MDVISCNSPHYFALLNQTNRDQLVPQWRLLDNGSILSSNCNYSILLSDIIPSDSLVQDTHEGVYSSVASRSSVHKNTSRKNVLSLSVHFHLHRCFALFPSVCTCVRVRARVYVCDSSIIVSSLIGGSGVC